MTCSNSQILKLIKVVGSLGDTTINNALTYENGVLQFRGPLIRDTEVSGNYYLHFGTTASRLTQLVGRATSQISFEVFNGVVSTSLQFTTTGIVLGNSAVNAKGLQGLQDYSANYDNLSFTQRGYVDARIVGKPITPALADPQAGQDGYRIAWNQTLGQFDLVSPGAITAGADTQVIYNDTGVLVGQADFLYAASILSAPSVRLGHAALAGTDRVFFAESSDPTVNVHVRPKGDGHLFLSLLGGGVIIGNSASVNTVHTITANGNPATIDLALQPKGTDGKVYIGNPTEAGSHRYLKARGNGSDLHFRIQAKGTTGQVILEPASDGDTSIGSVKIGHGLALVGGTAVKKLYAQSDFTTTNLEVGGGGINSIILIGNSDENASSRLLEPGSSALNCNLKISGKGTGMVSTNGIYRSKKVSIGDWNMDSTFGVTVPHGLGADFTKIVSVEVVVWNDASGSYGPLDRKSTGGTSVVQGGVVDWNNTVVALTRLTGGDYDNVNFDATGFNRGYIYINYEV